MHRSAAPAVSRPTHHQPHAWLTAALVAAVWFEVLWQAARHAPALSLPPALAAAAGLTTQLVFTALEASLGVAAWAALGVRARWSVLLPLLLAVSSVEAAAVALASGRPALPAPWAVLLAGPRAAPDPAELSAGAQAFAAFGALTVLRLLLAAHAHTRAAAVTWRRAALLVLAFYLATRCAMWWSLDLMQGRSYVGHVHEPEGTEWVPTTAGSA